MLPHLARQAVGLQHRTGAVAAAAALWSRRLASAPGTGVDSADTHDDFKPRRHGDAASGNSVEEQIKADISAHDVFVFMKGVPSAPQCGFSNMACKVLDAYGVRYGARNVLTDPALREGIKKFSEWPTIPQVFVHGQLIGGSDILFNMHESGELEKLLGPIIAKQQGAGGTGQGSQQP